MRTAFLFMLLLSPIFAFSVEDIVSISLDNVPYVSNFKNLIEFISGKDIVTDEELSPGNRIFSFFGIFPWLNYFKNTKLLKNAKKFEKAAERAKKANKMKNFLNFKKAGERTMKKANYFKNIANTIFESTKAFYNSFRNKNESRLF